MALNQAGYPVQFSVDYPDRPLHRLLPSSLCWSSFQLQLSWTWSLGEPPPEWRRSLRVELLCWPPC